MMRYALTIISLVAAITGIAYAEEFSSSNYTVSDPVFRSGHYASSTSFQLQSILSQIGIGTSSAATGSISSGFLYFPFVVSPIVSATAGDASVSLSWTSASSGGGWTVESYEVGKATSSSGPYSFSSIGSGTSSTITGLSNGTAYYFVVRVLDSLGYAIATTSPVSATPVAASGGDSGGGGGGGGGGSIMVPPSSGPITVNFTGRAYPKSSVTFLKDGQVVTTTTADAKAMFSVSVTVTPGTYMFSVYSEDFAGNRSSLLTFPVSVTSGTTNIGGIFIAPTIDVDKSQVRQGDTINIFGQSISNGEITILVNSEEEIFKKVTTDESGAYLLQFDSSVLEKGDHLAKSKAATTEEISSFSKAVSFKVGDISMPKVKPTAKKGDLNGDGKVNLVDFSIAAFWYKKTLSADFSEKESAVLNGDGQVNLADFSIIAYYWTG